MTKDSKIYYKTCRELLQDKKYLLWRFTPSKKSDKYWGKLLEQYPGLEKEINLADIYLKENIFPKKHLTESKKEEVLDDIYDSALFYRDSKIKRVRKIRSFARYAVAVSFLLLSGLLIYKMVLTDDYEQITVNQLAIENIQIIYADKSIQFEKNISIDIDEKGMAVVKGEDDIEDYMIDIDTQYPNTIIVPYGKRATLTLSDGSKVWLNSGSTLTFPSKFDKSIREVTLVGQMYIEVAEDASSPFFVETAEFRVKVLGTKFCVSAYEDQEQAVALVEGKVNLISNELKAGFPLLPNEIAVLDISTNAFDKHETDVLQYITWTKGYLTLNNTPMGEVLTYISRYYNLALDCTSATNLKSVTCNGKLYLSEDIENVMKSIATLSNTNYRKTDNTIFISNN